MTSDIVAITNVVCRSINHGGIGMKRVRGVMSGVNLMAVGRTVCFDTRVRSCLNKWRVRSRDGFSGIVGCDGDGGAGGSGASGGVVVDGLVSGKSLLAHPLLYSESVGTRDGGRGHTCDTTTNFGTSTTYEKREYGRRGPLARR